MEPRKEERLLMRPMVNLLIRHRQFYNDQRLYIPIRVGDKNANLASYVRLILVKMQIARVNLATLKCGYVLSREEHHNLLYSDSS